MPCTRSTASRFYKWKIKPPYPVTASVIRLKLPNDYFGGKTSDESQHQRSDQYSQLAAVVLANWAIRVYRDYVSRTIFRGQQLWRGGTADLARYAAFYVRLSFRIHLRRFHCILCS